MWDANLLPHHPQNSPDERGTTEVRWGNGECNSPSLPADPSPPHVERTCLITRYRSAKVHLNMPVVMELPPPVKLRFC